MTYYILVLCHGEVSSRKLIDTSRFAYILLVESLKHVSAIGAENE